MIFHKKRLLFFIVTIFFSFTYSNNTPLSVGLNLDFEEVAKELNNKLIVSSREITKNGVVGITAIGGFFFALDGFKKVIHGNNNTQIFNGPKYSWKTKIIIDAKPISLSQSSWTERFKGFLQMATGGAIFYWAWKNLDQKIS